MIRRRTVDSAGLPLAVFEQGDPAHPTVILVHGYPDTHVVWDDIAEDLAVDHHVVRYDVRGAGESGVPANRDGYRLERLGADLFAVADAVSPDAPVHVVAHDWGSVQSWEAVTEPGAEQRLASYTTMSGPCLDHLGFWMRKRFRRPTPRHLRQLLVQGAHSWYITAFHLPLLAPATWKLWLAKSWPRVLRDLEAVNPRPGHPQATLKQDAVRGIELYRANMRPTIRSPRERYTEVPVQLLTLSRDHYVNEFLSEGLEHWAPRLTRRTVNGTHWSALLEHGPVVAAHVRSFIGSVAAGSEPEATGELVVITGAGSGIGRATALAFAAEGARVVVCDLDLESAVRTAELCSLSGGTGYAYQLDVSDGAAFDAFAQQIAAEHGVPDVLVNNAGIGHSGTFLQTTEKEWQRVLDVNLWGVIHGCRAFGTLMAERGHGGHIVNLASAAAYLPSKALAAYATSKAAVRMLSDCLRAELASSGVGVSAICPGLINTNITRTSTFSATTADEQAAKQARAAKLYARRNFPPEKVATEILKAVRTGKAVVPVTAEAKGAYFLSRFAPGLLRLAARLNVT
ncbi:NAD(P)-dependent dehydrogenase (short-subunit alcohol dehydrogenase family)/pimeloyl-ACP methyl ester carboxylesterase [Kitasatospora gansuensis]|uniref:NAD(P)-dependent dehydrogenase (Short-subunit alcohol dehydrogenase family)/pimeloyl-ACP methyl ester carboxylesterase n=1 Tax=Kitasatospora gansuensis TaxID=258050 RepID=A0A7W7SA79_9ACTN|nr:SDR family oxidoreductase [Kitasatospora gansuensis]MBB4945671.1 NAD(P)-dependent dehydrogenase (short-subunit alcohol dehydrogenase family)/pimeloyl-ACP methyl ester carboxylesterase [Kitasatospora gansuensis]